MNERKPTEDNPFARAIDIIEKTVRVDGELIKRNQLQAALKITHSWFYRGMREGQTSLNLALKLEMLTGGQVTWKELCPPVAHEYDEIKQTLGIPQ